MLKHQDELFLIRFWSAQDVLSDAPVFNSQAMDYAENVFQVTHDAVTCVASLADVCHLRWVELACICRKRIIT